jgi:hypothetical protein
MRRYASTAQRGSRTSFTLPLVLQEPAHTDRQQPALNNLQLPVGLYTISAKSLHRNSHQHNSRHPTLRPTKPRPCARPHGTQPEQEVRQHCCTLNVAIARACTIAPSFSVHNWPTSGGNRPLTHSANGNCHAPRHRNDMK